MLLPVGHLQLGAYEKARQVLQADFDRTTKARGPGSLHFLETFYMGIIYYELRDYDKAAEWLDKSLAVYTHFSDARYYKGLCLLKKGDKTNATLLMKEAKADFEKGYSITEDDAFYVTYPYQVNWYMAKWIIPGDKL